MLSDVTKTPRDFLLQRPDDFMAEMAKSDDHMQKVCGVEFGVWGLGFWTCGFGFVVCGYCFGILGFVVILRIRF